jgi:hypothetical protein
MANRESQRRSVVALVLRALRSTIVISAVALLVAALRQGRFQLGDLTTAMTRYWGLAVAVFFALLIWDVVFHRPKRPRLVDADEG